MSGSMRMKVGLDLASLHGAKFDEQLAASYEGQAISPAPDLPGPGAAAALIGAMVLEFELSQSPA